MNSLGLVRATCPVTCALTILFPFSLQEFFLNVILVPGIICIARIIGIPVFPLFNWRHPPRDFKAITSRRGTLYFVECCVPASNAVFDGRVCLSQTGLLVVYVINAGISYLSYLEAKRVGQVSSGTTTRQSLMGLVSILELGSKCVLLNLVGGRWRYSCGVHSLELGRNNA